MTTLIIAEKPELGKSIMAALRSINGGTVDYNKEGYTQLGDITVTWCFGHMLELFEPEDYFTNEDEAAAVKNWSFDSLPVCTNIPWQKKIRQSAKKQYNIIKRLMNEADEIIHAGDPDEEGQLLIDEILQKENCKKPVKRLLINDNNEKIIKRAYESMQPNEKFEALGRAAEARSVSDKIYGYNMTRAYTLKGREQGYNSVLSVGRVQTPILGLVVRRDLEIEKHQKSYFYTVIGEFENGKGMIKAKYKPIEGNITDDQNRLSDANQAQSLADEIKAASCLIESIKTQNKKTPPPLPYNLIKLQMDASNALKLSPSKVQDITQDLREKYKLITYNRSDCQYLSEEQHSDAAAVLSAIKQNLPAYTDSLDVADPSIKSLAFNSAKVSAHHAIIPTEATPEIQKLKKDELAIYEMIAKRYVMQFYPDYEFKETKVTIKAGERRLYATINEPQNIGWKQYTVADAVKVDDEEGEIANMPSFEETEGVNCKNIAATKQETKPKAKYTEATLLADLTQVAKYVVDPKIKEWLKKKDEGKAGEHGGIGTPATRAEIIKKLFDTGYLVKEGKFVVSTPVGRQFYECLPDQAKFPDLTALWAERQEEIKQDKLSVEEFIKEQIEYCNGEIERVKIEGLNIVVSLPECPACFATHQGRLRKIKNKEGKEFLSCSRYPDCKHTANLGKNGQPEKEIIGGKCPKCEGDLLLKQGKTPFFGCRNYPTCDYKCPANGKKALIIKEDYACPKCGSKLNCWPSTKEKNKFYFSCGNYPECKFSCPEKDAAPDFEAKPKHEFKCPDCGLPLAYIQKGKPFWSCKGYFDNSCKKTFKDNGGEPDFSPPNQPSEIYKCATCGKALIKRHGKNGAFWACTAKECNVTYNDKNGVPEI